MKAVVLVSLCLVVLALAKPPQLKANLDDIQYILFTRNGPSSGEEVPFNFVNLPSNFDASRKTYFLTHGWNSNINFANDFIPALLDDSDCNVFGIDWSRLENLDYISAAQTSIQVGARIGSFAAKLKLLGVSENNIHAIGHSLGAQASGHLGRQFAAETGVKLARVTGLDPAKPWFDITNPSNTMSKNDAKFVDIIHTNSGNLPNGCLSFPEPLGHVDFYPAGGEHQPGCTEICAPNCNDNDLIDLIKGGCSHSRANKYFVESITSNRFVATKCDSWQSFLDGNCASGATQSMGFPTSSSASQGSYYLNVNSDSPFAQG